MKHLAYLFIILLILAITPPAGAAQYYAGPIGAFFQPSFG